MQTTYLKFKRFPLQIAQNNKKTLKAFFFNARFALQTVYYIRTEQYIICRMFQLSRIQNHFSKTRTTTLNILLALLWLWKLKVNQSTVHHFCALFIYLRHSQNRLLKIFLCLCIFFCIYLLTVFHWMRLYLLYLVYFYFYTKVGLWIYFSYLICFILSFVDSY